MIALPVELDIVVDAGVTFTPVCELSELIAFASLRQQQTVSGRWGMTARLTCDDNISVLHERFFHDPDPTDVISFPSGELDSGDEGYLGDVIVSLDTGAVQAAAAGHSVEREVAFLLLHGFLHLCGFTDATPAERGEMLDRQEQLLHEFESAQGRPW